MPETAPRLRALIDAELVDLDDARVAAHVRDLLVEPVPVLRDWDYGEEDEQYTCWSVLEHPQSATGIAFCDAGFGPGRPWGLVNLPHDAVPPGSMGMDCSWFSRFLDAYFDSLAATELPIWRVLRSKAGADGGRVPLTPEMGWDEDWAEVKALRAGDSAGRYHCGHTVVYRGRPSAGG
jgi:hypothetical protein